MPVMSLPRSWTLPAEGRTAPVIRLNSVVLPAPLGPMKPEICFSATAKLTSFSAATPPKYLLSVVTSRIFTAFSPEEPAQQTQEPVGLKQDDQDQQRSVEQQAGVLKMDGELLFHHAENQPSHHRSPHRADAADHRHEENRNTGLERQYVSRCSEPIRPGIGPTSPPG